MFTILLKKFLLLLPYLGNCVPVRGTKWGRVYSFLQNHEENEGSGDQQGYQKKYFWRENKVMKDSELLLDH